MKNPSSWKHASATITSPSAKVASAESTPYEFRLHYVDVAARSGTAQEQRSKPKGTILLIHGFPETWYEFRNIIDPLADAGYRVIAPDYRGAGSSQAPPSNAGYAGGKGGGYTKAVMADDIHTLLYDTLGIKEKVHVFGHDIGGMVSHAYASWFPEHTASLICGECPLPGTTFYENVKNSPAMWHFTFHNVQDDLPERLVQGNERTYMRNFFDRLSLNPWAIAPGSEDEDVFVNAYSRPGAMRAAFDTYRAFEQDGKNNREQVQKHGKTKLPVLGLTGASSFFNATAKEQLQEFHENVEEDSVPNSSHYFIDEQPEATVGALLKWLKKFE